MRDIQRLARQFGGAILIVLLSVLAVFALVVTGNVYSSVIAPQPPVVVRGFSLSYYRAARFVDPPLNMLDPYDCFQKDEYGDLIISPSGTNKAAVVAQAVYNGYILKTHQGTPITVFQETPSRRQRHKSNCHGLTFLAGDYWLLGSQVQRILDNGGWKLVAERDARPGDVAVYRDGKERITHTARVTGRDAEGHICVDSKNGFEKKLESVRAATVVPY